MSQPHLTPMQRALALAEQAASDGEVPVGAVIVLGGEVIAASANRMRTSGDATAHAEMEAIRQALETLGTGRLADCDLYVTLEPCTMCAGAIAHARLRRLYFGAEDKKAGAVENGVRFFDSESCNHRPEIISGIDAEPCAELLRKFFAARR